MKSEDQAPSGVELVLDRKLPGVQDLTVDWKDGGTYHVKITQISSKGNKVVLKVEEMGGGDMGEMEDDAEEESAPVAPKPSMKVPYKE